MHKDPLALVFVLARYMNVGGSSPAKDLSLVRAKISLHISKIILSNSKDQWISQGVLHSLSILKTLIVDSMEISDLGPHPRTTRYKIESDTWWIGPMASESTCTHLLRYIMNQRDIHDAMLYFGSQRRCGSTWCFRRYFKTSSSTISAIIISTAS